MIPTSIFVLTSLVASAVAHYRISYPEPRGPYISDEQVNFCDGYTEASSNRTDFPLSDGFIRLNNSHAHFSAAVLISIEQNPSNFGVFNTSTTGIELPLAVDWFSAEGAGEICIPVDIASLNIEGVGDGSNVTLQTMLAGGDGNLFQCVDLTLRENTTIPSDITCSRTVDTSVGLEESDHDHDDDSSNAQRVVAVAPGLLGIAIALLLI